MFSFVEGHVDIISKYYLNLLAGKGFTKRTRLKGGSSKKGGDGRIKQGLLDRETAAPVNSIIHFHQTRKRMHTADVTTGT